MSARFAWPRTLRIPIYPLALVVIGFLTLFVNAGEPLAVIFRPLALTVLAVLLLQALFSLLLRSQARGAVATLLLALLLAGLWPLAMAVLVLPAWWLALAAIRDRRHEPPLSPRPLLVAQRVLNLFSVALLLIGVVTAGLVGALHWYAAPGGRPSADADLPNIYLVQLDGYPGLDTVKDRLGIDNEAFAQTLVGAGFQVVRGSRSNYTDTWPTLASMLDMRYLADEPGLFPVPADLGEQRRRLTRIENNGRALADLRAIGYRIVTQPSAFSSAALLTADTVRDGGQLTEFEELLLRKSGIISLLGDAGQSWVASQARDRIESGIDALGSASFAEPTLFFDHILAPHPPFLHQADGSPAPLRDCYPRSCPFWVTELDGSGTPTVASYAQAMQAELTYLNARILAAVGELVARDPSAIVILYSDHGMRYDPDDTEEHVANFFAARTPGKPDLFNPDLSLVNVFPELLNAYLGTSYPTLPYRAWQSGLLPLDLTPIPAP